MSGLPKTEMLKLGYAMVKYGMKYPDAVALYGKYVANWGGEATAWRLDGKKNGEVVASVTCCPSAKLHLEVTPSHTALKEGVTYDMAAVRVRVLDEFGNPAPYGQLPIRFRLEGAADLVGPNVATAEGGMTGTYIRTNFQKGNAILTVSAHGLEPVTVEFTIE
jgi:beta-galactosidase